MATLSANPTTGRVNTESTITITLLSAENTVTNAVLFSGLSTSGGMLAVAILGTGLTRTIVLTLPATVPSGNDVTVTLATLTSPVAVAGDQVAVTVLVAVVSSRRGREALANPAAKNYGTNILGIAAEQADYFTPRTLLTKTPDAAALAAAGVYPNVIEFRPPYSLTPVKEFYPVERYKGNPSPDPSIPGMQMGAGEIHFYLDATSISFWIKHLLQAITVASLSFGTYTPSTAITLTLGAGSGTDLFGDPERLGPVEQPKDVIQATGNFAAMPPGGMTACRIKLTFTSSDADIEVSGKDHNGAELSEILTGSARTTQTTVHYYADDVRIAKRGTGDLAVSALEYELSSVYQHELKFCFRGF